MRHAGSTRWLRVVVAGPSRAVAAVLETLKAPLERERLVLPGADDTRLELDGDAERLGDADVLLVVADAKRGARADNADAFARVRERLTVAERSLGELPHVFGVLRASGLERLTALSPERVLTALGAGPVASLTLDLGAADLARRLTDLLVPLIRRGLADERIQEPALREARGRAWKQSLARGCLGAHYARFFGDAVREYTPARTQLPVVVFEHRPTASRDWWTYATAGLSFHEREAEADRRLELVAYSAEARQAVADALLALCQTLTGPWARDRVAPFDTCDLSELGNLDVSRFILAPAREPSALLEFPDGAPDENLRFTAFVDEPRRVRFLEAFPVSEAELSLARREGSMAVLGQSPSHRPGPRALWTAPLPLPT